MHLPNQPPPPVTGQAVTLETVNLQIDVTGPIHTLIIGALGGQKLLGCADQLRVPMDALFAANFRKQWQELADRTTARENGAAPGPVHLAPPNTDPAG